MQPLRPGRRLLDWLGKLRTDKGRKRRVATADASARWTGFSDLRGRTLEDTRHTATPVDRNSKRNASGPQKAPAVPSGPATITGGAARPLRQCKKEGNGRRGRVGNRGTLRALRTAEQCAKSPFRALPSGRADINNRAQSHLLFKARNLPVPAFVRQRHSTSAGFEALRNQRLCWKHQVPGAKQQNLIAAAGRAAPSKSHSRNRNPRFRKHATPTFREQMPQSASAARQHAALGYRPRGHVH